MTTYQKRGAWLGSAVALMVLALAAVPPATLATEPKDDFSLQLRLVETVPGKGHGGPSMTGVARIEVLVEAFRATKDIQLTVLRPNGSEWTVNGRRFTTEALAWSDPGGEPQESGANGPSVPAHGAMRTTIAVPLQGAAIHEIVLTATGLVDGATIRTEGIVRVALGVPDGQPVDDGIYANFSLQEVK